MEAKVEPRLADLKLLRARDVENLVVIPEGLFIPQGVLARALYAELERDGKRFEGCYSQSLRYNDKSGEMEGSTIFDVLRARDVSRRIIKGAGLDVVVPADDANGEIRRLTLGRHYVDFPRLALISLIDRDDSRNNSLIAQLVDKLGIDGAKIEATPALISGFSIEPMPQSKETYKLQLVKREGFDINYDDRLLSKWKGFWFNKVDRIGMPEGLHEKRVNEDDRQYFVRGNGLSGFGLSGGGGLRLDWFGLDDSLPFGRMVLKSAEGTRA